MRLLLAALVLAIAPVAVGAQKAGTEYENAQAAFKALKAEYEKAIADYRAAMMAVQKTPEYQEARKNRDREAAMALTSKIKFDGQPIVSRARFAAKKFKNDPDVAYLHAWLVGNGGKKEIVDGSMEVLAEKFIEHPAMEEASKAVAAQLRRGMPKEKVHGFLEKVASANPNKVVQATALFMRAQLLDGRGASSADKAMAEEFLAKVQELAPGSIMAMRAAGPKFEKTRLQIGMVAPDIEGEDLEGNKFKLSDYRGKVVVLDFWGDW